MKRAVRSLHGGDGIAWTRKHDLGKGSYGFVSSVTSKAPIIASVGDGDGDDDISVVSWILRVFGSSGHELDSKILQNKQGTDGGVPTCSSMLNLPFS